MRFAGEKQEDPETGWSPDGYTLAHHSDSLKLFLLSQRRLYWIDLVRMSPGLEWTCIILGLVSESAYIHQRFVGWLKQQKQQRYKWSCFSTNTYRGTAERRVAAAHHLVAADECEWKTGGKEL